MVDEIRYTEEMSVQVSTFLLKVYLGGVFYAISNVSTRPEGAKIKFPMAIQDLSFDSWLHQFHDRGELT